VTLDERGGASQTLAAKGAPLKLVPVGGDDGDTASAGILDPRRGNGTPVSAGPPAALSAWSTIAPYPTPFGFGLGDFGNRADVINGKLYSVGSAWSGEKNHAFVYDPTANAWTPIADSPVRRDAAAVVADNGKLYVTGGFDSAGNAIAETDVYNPSTDTWTSLTPDPTPTSSMGVAVANGVIYLVGGCTNASSCPGSSTVETYNPRTRIWASVAPYPHPDSWLSCGGIGGKVYCAGGIDSPTTYADGYVYNPLTNAWSPIASLPIDLWGSASGAANGLLLISTGVTNDSTTVTNQGYAYDPTTDTWSSLPNAQFPAARSAGACGFYKIGGITFPQVFEPSERISGLTQCGTTDVPWMSESGTTITLQPGQSARIRVTLSATSAGKVTRPGTYTAQIGFQQDTPYDVFPENVTMTVTPPSTSGKIAGFR
jgi:N-acetylneuraminic acid mutarotase